MSGRRQPLLLPPALSPGDRITVLSPSAPDAGRSPRRLARAVHELATCGFDVSVAPRARAVLGPTAGRVKDRVADFEEAVLDPDVRAIMTAVGGHNANELLDYLDLQLLRSHPTLVVGNSDATALLLPIWAQAGLVTVMGPQLLPQFGEVNGCSAQTRESWLRTAAGERPEGPWRTSREWTDEFLEWDVADVRLRRLLPNPGPRVVRAGTASGELCGANIETLLRLSGTPHWPDLSGCVLFIESSNRFSPGLLRAQLTQLRQTGALDAVVGVAVGRFPGTSLDGADDVLLTELLLDVLPSSIGPVAAGLDFGHTDPMNCVPNGVQARLCADPAAEPTVSVLVQSPATNARR